MEQLEQEIYDMWTELRPDIAFRCGVQNKAGEFFIPTDENIERMLRKIGELKVETLDSVNLGLLNCFETTLKFEEPYHIIYDSLWAYFAYITKEGIDVPHITSLTQNIIKALKTVAERINSQPWSIEIKTVTMNNALGLLGVVSSIEKEAPALKSVLEELRKELKTYLKMLNVNGIKEGDFSEIYPILEAKGGNIGRKEIYPNILKHMYGFLETTEEIETQALNWLSDEKPRLKRITEQLASIHKTKPTIEAVAEKINKRNTIKKSGLIAFIQKLRVPLRILVEENIVRITPKYDTKVLETPNYLLNFISTGAMEPFDIHTDSPFNIFFITTDTKRSPPINASDLFQLVIHEEFGHCVHFSNSATHFKAKISLVDLIITTLMLPISDGISFYREWEALELLQRVIKKPEYELTPTEKEFLDIIRSITDPNLFLLEAEFTILRWRIIRFLRAIGDVRINMHQQSIAEFITWAHEYTEFSKKAIFDQIFLFMARPGYAPCYSIVGERIRELQYKAKARGRQKIDFNTYASSLGFPPRAVFEQKLNDF